MSAVTLHRETVKAQIRMRHGSLAAFATAEKLDAQQVRDTLRGMSRAAIPAMAKLLGLNADQLEITRDSTKVELHNIGDAVPHRLNAVGR